MVVGQPGPCHGGQLRALGHFRRGRPAAQRPLVTIDAIASIAVIMRLVQAGIGIASMPLAAIEQELDSNQVALIASNVRLPHLPMMISYRPEPGNQILDAVVETARRGTRAYCTAWGNVSPSHWIDKET